MQRTHKHLPGTWNQSRPANASASYSCGSREKRKIDTSLKATKCRQHRSSSSSDTIFFPRTKPIVFLASYVSSNKITLTWTFQDERRTNCSYHRNESRFGIRDRALKEKAASAVQLPSSSLTGPSSDQMIPYFFPRIKERRIRSSLKNRSQFCPNFCFLSHEKLIRIKQKNQTVLTSFEPGKEET